MKLRLLINTHFFSFFSFFFFIFIFYKERLILELSLNILIYFCGVRLKTFFGCFRIYMKYEICTIRSTTLMIHETVSPDDLDGVEVILGRLLIRSNKLKCLSCNK